MAQPLVSPQQIGPGGVPLSGEPLGVYSQDRAHEGISASYWDKFWAQSALNLIDAPVGLPIQVGQDGGFEGSIVRGIRQSYTEFQAKSAGSLKLNPDELNKRYPGLPVPFSEPEYPEVAKLKFDHNERTKRLQAWVSRGPQTGLGFDLATGAAVGADPVNLALGMALGSARAGLGLASGIRTVFAENLVANTLGEIPSIIQRPRENQPSRGFGEVATNVVAGSALGTGIQLGIHASIDYALHRATQAVKNTPKSEIARNVESAVKASESGARFDVGPAAVTRVIRESGQVRSDVENGYAYRPLTQPNEVHYFVAQDPDTGAFVVPEENGGGIVGVDNRAVANNASGLPESATPGKVIRAELAQDARLLDSDTPMRELFEKGLSRDQMEEKVRGILGNNKKFDEVWKEFRDVWRERGTVGDLFTVFQDAATDRIRTHNDIPAGQFKTLIDGLGYDGIKFRGKLGDSAIDNRILVYSHEKLRPVETSDSSPEIVPQMSQDQQRGFSEIAVAPENRRFHDPEMERAIEAKSSMSDEQVDVAAKETQIKTDEDAARAYLDELSKEPEFAGLKVDIEKIDAEDLIARHNIEAVKNLVRCVSETAV